jgi:tetratricopeptide (TPR) repeat protein
MTLGRALLDSGEMAGARQEFESVLKGAPDNILASRYLGEALEGLGDLGGAVDRYRKTLLLAPGDKALTQRIGELVQRLAGPAAGADARPEVASQDREAPIPLSAVDGEEFELEGPLGGAAALTAVAAVAAPVETAPAQAAPASFLGGMEEGEWEAVAPEASERGGGEAAGPALLEERGAAALPEAAAPGEAGAPGPPGVLSATVGELYAAQGHVGEAAAIYRELARREPGNAAHAVRALELEAAEALRPGPPGLPEPVAAARPADEEPEPGVGGEDLEGDRRQALERTVDRLGGWLSVVRRGRQ